MSMRDSKLKTMDKLTVIAKLHAMIDLRLFGDRPWLADREACPALNRTLEELGLQESVPGEKYSIGDTVLGKELNIDLVTVFIGLWDGWEVPYILEKNGLIDEIETDRIYDLMETTDDPEHILRPVVRKAFLDYYNPSQLLV